MTPRVNLAVCGDFCQLQLVPCLNGLADIGKVYYAARRSRNAASLGLSENQACNVYLKEYLVHFHARYLRHIWAERAYPIYNQIWEKTVLHNWNRCDLLHVVLQGTALDVIKRAKQEGAAILGHPVMSHPIFCHEQLDLEVQKLGIAPTSAFFARSNILAQEIELCDHIFCLSGLVRDTFIAKGFPKERIDVVPFPTDLTTFQPAPKDQRQTSFRVLCVADISPTKGHVYLLEAWRKLGLDNAELLLVGTMRSEMAPVLARYEGQFRYTGPLDKSSLVRAYQQSSLLVLPSVQDGFGLVVSEALACGTPVIVTDHVGARDIIRSGANGFVLPARDVDALAATIQAIHSSDELRARLRAGAMASRATFPTVAETAAQLAALYDRVVRQRRAAE
jgi:glycosyltransferase involved in cell wall biosynthesis